MEEFESFLYRNGYTKFVCSLDKSTENYYKCTWQKRIDEEGDCLCDCNDKLHMNIKIFSGFSITGYTCPPLCNFEMSFEHDGHWYDFKAYGINEEEALNSYEKIFNNLKRASQAMSRTLKYYAVL